LKIRFSETLFEYYPENIFHNITPTTAHVRKITINNMEMFWLLRQKLLMYNLSYTQYFTLSQQTKLKNCETASKCKDFFPSLDCLLVSDEKLKMILASFLRSVKRRFLSSDRLTDIWGIERIKCLEDPKKFPYFFQFSWLNLSIK